MKLVMRMVLVITVVVVLMNIDSNKACRVLNTDVLQKGTVNPPNFPLTGPYEGTKLVSSTGNQGLLYLSNGGIHIPSIIRQRLDKGTVPSGGNPPTNVP
ncbi:hypothetical protein M0R45_010687 [Rubus argutus]|uniref:Uncharacterized protein n=1 Tax=Rubus argutus TaxID=59490 RepID=A0AAW1Y800_RUBAR